MTTVDASCLSVVSTKETLFSSEQEATLLKELDEVMVELLGGPVLGTDILSQERNDGCQVKGKHSHHPLTGHKIN